MVLVEGDYCPEAEQRCAKWMESPEKFSYARCAEFDPHPTCQRPREHRRFCIDAREYTPAGETLPAVQISFTAAASLCEKQDKRLCLESEWEFACEGEAMSPYPYGFVRDATACNFEKTELYRPDGSLRDLRDASGAHPRCTSPFGVSDMVGNIDEWTVRESMGARAAHASRFARWVVDARAQPLPRSNHGPRRTLPRSSNRVPLLRLAALTSRHGPRPARA